MHPYGSASITVAFSLCDAVLGFLFYIHGTNIALFGKDVFQYDFAQCLFEFWLFSALRLALMLGGSIGLLCNHSDATERIHSGKVFIGAMTTVMFVVVIAKILLYTEYINGDHSDDVWFWTSAVWCGIASLCMYGLWVYVLGSKQATEKKRLTNSLMNISLNREEEEEEDKESTGSESESDNSSDDDEEDWDRELKIGILKTRNKKKKGKGQKGGSAFLRLLSYSKHDWLYLLLGFIALLIAASGEVFLPLYTGKVIDGIVITEDRPNFTKSLIIMTLISVGVAIAEGIRGGFFTLAMARLNLRITSLLYHSIMGQDMGFFDKTRTGAITSRLTSDTSTMSNTLALNVNICLRSCVKMIGYVIFMLIISWRLTIVTLVSLPLIAVMSDVFGSYYEKLSKAVQSSLAKANIVAEETISSMKTVRSFANEAGEEKEYRRRLGVTYRLRKKEAVAYGGFVFLQSTCDLLMFVVTLFYGGHLVMNSLMSGGMLVSFILYQLELGECLEDIGEVYTSLMSATGASLKVFKLIDRKPAFKNEGKLKPAEFKGHLEFRNVTFYYPTRPDIPVLKNVSFTAHPGEVIALVGPSGGGKSSCISLLEHFYEPISGEVLLDGISVKEYDHTYLHSKIALVGQEPVLYARSIQDNIAYGMEECSEECIQRAAELANAHGFITDLKKGYKTETGEKGLQISGGQKQRVAIARALVRGPKMLLLDEATSALDAESEHQVQQALTQNFRDYTVVIVAHRLSTIERSDRIIVIDQGMVVEQGRHQELIKAGGLYSQLVQRQLLGQDEEKETEPGNPDITSHHGNKVKRKRTSGDEANLGLSSDSESSSGSSSDSLNSEGHRSQGMPDEISQQSVSRNGSHIQC
ncbi:ABC-type oligopeptide transporter ABCB9-like [Diadema antillarum]|uniref:ABC-type oligopeptide transporter ABCB9-like n=1 Tax=Diadema antillarum TaxID=105358 RepID=UPI003A87D368